MQLQGQKVCVFDDITSGDGDLAGSQVLSLRDFIPSQRLQGWFLKMWRLLWPSIYLWGLPDSVNKSLPSLLHPGTHGAPAPMVCWGRGSRAGCAHTTTLSGGSTPVGELALPKERKVRWLKTQGQISANPRRTGIKYKHVRSALQHCHRSAMPTQIWALCRGKNTK